MQCTDRPGCRPHEGVRLCGIGDRRGRLAGPYRGNELTRPYRIRPYVSRLSCLASLFAFLSALIMSAIPPSSTEGRLLKLCFIR